MQLEEERKKMIADLVVKQLISLAHCPNFLLPCVDRESAVVEYHTQTSLNHLPNNLTHWHISPTLIFFFLNRSGDRFIEEKTLLLAVRSYVFFSQLSAWLSASHGIVPRNILYRSDIMFVEDSEMLIGGI